MQADLAVNVVIITTKSTLFDSFLSWTMNNTFFQQKNQGIGDCTLINIFTSFGHAFFPLPQHLPYHFWLLRNTLTPIFNSQVTLNAYLPIFLCVLSAKFNKQYHWWHQQHQPIHHELYLTHATPTLSSSPSQNPNKFIVISIALCYKCNAIFWHTK